MAKIKTDIWIAARNHATRLGFANDAEDFAQEAVQKLSSGRQTTLENLFIDYLRHYYGRKLKGAHNKTMERLAYTVLDSAMNPRGILEDKPRDTMNAEDCARLVNYLKGEGRALFILRYVWGYSLKELGYLYGVTDSAISLRIGAIQKFLVQEVRRENNT